MAGPTRTNALSWSHWYYRAPLKLVVFLIVVLFALYPNPVYLIRQIPRLMDLDSMVTPDAPELAWMEALVRASLQHEVECAAARNAGNARYFDPPTRRRIELQFPDGIPPEHSILMPLNDQHEFVGPQRWPQPDQLPIRFAYDLSGFDSRRVQSAVVKLVYSEIKYAWDWNVWGVADYMPTVSEIFSRAAAFPDGKAREDCEGQAIVAASLMRRLGYEARLVTDLLHVWVVTPEGEWMTFGFQRHIALESAPHGTVLRWSAAILNLPVALAFGAGVYPLEREFIIVLALYLLLLHRRMNRMAALLGGLLIVQGLLFMKFRYYIPYEDSLYSTEWTAWIGLGHAAAGIATLLTASYRARRMMRKERVNFDTAQTQSALVGLASAE